MTVGYEAPKSTLRMMGMHTAKDVKLAETYKIGLDAAHNREDCELAMSDDLNMSSS